MGRPRSKKETDILEERGYWKASSYLHKIVKRLIKKGLSLEIRYIKEAHRIIFLTAMRPDLAGKYRRDNPEVKRIDGSLLKISHWHYIPNHMSELDAELRERTKNLKKPGTEKDYENIIRTAAKLSHRLACIHPFENGNGRASRLLLSATLLRAGLPDIAIKDPKPRYLRAMRQADNADLSSLERIILKGLIESKDKLYKIQQRKRAELMKRKKRHIYKKR